jgi:hypothetical protein
MMWVHVLLLLIATGALRPVLGDTVPTSPCPNLFRYELEASGKWSGRMNIAAPPKGSSVKTAVELQFDNAVNVVSSNYF